MIENLDARIDKTFSVVAFTVNRHLIDHMRRVTLELGVDLETTYIWGLLAHLNTAHLINVYPGLEDALSDTGSTIRQFRPMRLVDLTEISGLPRETVRRRLEKLKKLGKVERNENGCWQIKSSGVDEHTRQFTRETIRRLLNAARTIEASLLNAEL